LSSHPRRLRSARPPLLAPPRLPQGNILQITIPASLEADLSKLPSVDTSSVTQYESYVVPASWDLSAAQAQQAYRIAAYVFTVIAVLVFVIVLALRRSISVAIDVIKVGSDALRSLPSLVLFPITTVIALAVFLVWWVFVAASLATAATITVGNVTAEAQEGLAYLAANNGSYAISASTYAILVNASNAANATIAAYDVSCRLWA
jgi:hypothetical protein